MTVAGLTVSPTGKPSVTTTTARRTGAPSRVRGAERTGGASVYANREDYGPLFRELAEEVTSTYVLAFYPPEQKRRDGRFHTIRIEAPQGYTIRQSRTGYQAEGGTPQGGRPKAEGSR